MKRKSYVQDLGNTPFDRRSFCGVDLDYLPMKFKLFNSKVIKLLGLFLVLLLLCAALFLRQGNLGEKPIATSEPTPGISPTPQPTQTTYEKGIVAVWFKQGTTYKEAEDLISGFGLDLENTNRHWQVSGFQPTDLTVLEEPDFFVVKVVVGKEAEIMIQLNQESIVKMAARRVQP